MIQKILILAKCGMNWHTWGIWPTKEQVEIQICRKLMFLWVSPHVLPYSHPCLLAHMATLRFRKAHGNKRETWTCEQQVDTKEFWWRSLYGLWSFHGERIKNLVSFVCIVMKCITMRTTFFLQGLQVAMEVQWRKNLYNVCMFIFCK